MLIRVGSRGSRLALTQAEQAAQRLRRPGIEIALVEEEEIEAGMRFVYERAKLACEPAGAAGIAALLACKVSLREGETVVAVVSGGNVSGETAAAILAQL